MKERIFSMHVATELTPPVGPWPEVEQGLPQKGQHQPDICNEAVESLCTGNLIPALP